jgi:hypothetical protein
MDPLRSLVAVLPIALASAQTVVPPFYANAEGNFACSDGIGCGANQSRFLQLTNSGARLVTALSFRRDGETSTTFPAQAIVADVYCSLSAKDYDTIDPVFDNNHGAASKVQVVTTGVFVFPQSIPGPIPNDFAYRFPFDRAFSHSGGRPLCWEIVTQYRTTAQPFALDKCGSWNANPYPAIFVGGTGCNASGQTSPATLDALATANWATGNQSFTYNGSFFPPGATVLMAFGVDAKNAGGLPLPFVLPGTATAPSGACTMYTDYVATAPVQADALGAFSATYGVNVKNATNGTSIFAQAIALDAGANGYGLVLSNLAQHNIIRPTSSFLPIAHVYLNGSLGPLGTVAHWQGLVVQLE